jgi:hypothetical protein
MIVSTYTWEAGEPGKTEWLDFGNKGFSKKVPHFAKSKFILKKARNEYVSWGIMEIEQRQLWLADLAVKAWPNKI